MHLAAGNRTLLSPETIGSDQGNDDGNAVTGHRERDPDLVESQSVLILVGSLQAKELGNQDPLHGNDHRGTDVGEECSFQS
jgi:hypothetical protein